MFLALYGETAKPMPRDPPRLDEALALFTAGGLEASLAVHGAPT